MTQEEKSLLLKDLCARLPYHPHCIGKEDEESKHFIIDGIEISTLIGGKICSKVKVYEANKTWSYQRTLEIEYIKPYLRPMSSMTNGELVEFLEIRGMNFNSEELRTFRGGETAIVSTLPSYSRHIDWLNEHHFDYRGLIKKGLAIEAPERI